MNLEAGAHGRVSSGHSAPEEDVQHGRTGVSQLRVLERTGKLRGGEETQCKVLHPVTDHASFAINITFLEFSIQSQIF